MQKLTGYFLSLSATLLFSSTTSAHLGHGNSHYNPQSLFHYLAEPLHLSVILVLISAAIAYQYFARKIAKAK